MAAERRSAQQLQTLSITISPSTGEEPGRAEGDTSRGRERSEALQRRDGSTPRLFVLLPRLHGHDGFCGGGAGPWPDVIGSEISWLCHGGGPGRTAAVQVGAHSPSGGFFSS